MLKAADRVAVFRYEMPNGELVKMENQWEIVDFLDSANRFSRKYLFEKNNFL